MKFILGKKIGMTQVWEGDKVVAVTKVQAGPCMVVQVKNIKKDGYSAVQLGYGFKKEKNIKKPQLGHMKGLGNFKHLKEFRIKDEKIEKGNEVKADTFNKGDRIKVTGTSIGKGFQGVVRRWGFSGQIKTHGTKDQVRMSGSIGAKGPAHVFKGTRMGGRMGGERVTVTNLEVVDVDVENNIILIKGAVPGSNNGLIEIKGEGELKVAEAVKLKEENTVEDKKESSAEVLEEKEAGNEEKAGDKK